MVRSSLLALALIALAPLPAVAEDVDFSIAATEACLLRSAGSVSCIGMSAELCINSPGGYSNVGRETCYAREQAYWNDRLEATMATMIEAGRASDSVLPEGSLLPRQEATLQALHTQWAAYRDAFCAFEDSTWGGGTGSYSAVQQCLMTLTATQVLLLEIGWELH